MKDSTLETSLDLNEIKTAYHGALKLPATSYISHLATKHLRESHRTICEVRRFEEKETFKTKSTPKVNFHKEEIMSFESGG